jgi:hypothetical protein
MTERPMLDGRELSEFKLAQIRRQIESLETIDVIRRNAGLDRTTMAAPVGEDQANLAGRLGGTSLRKRRYALGSGAFGLIGPSRK